MSVCIRRLFKSKTVLIKFLMIILVVNGKALEIDPLYLVISSLYREPVYGTTLIDRELHLHWDPKIYSKVGLFTQNPISEAEPVLVVTSADHPDGYLQSNITLGSPVFPAGWSKNNELTMRISGDHCLPFWLGAYKGNDLVHIQCLRIHPTWMNDHRLSIGELSLTALFIPGTHNSACYRRGESLSKRDTIGRYLLTQDFDVWSQLVFGIRYIDLRVGIYPSPKSHGSEEVNDDVFWVNHDLVKVRPLLPVLRDIRKFLDAAKHEVIILDLHRFPVGFTGRQHRHHILVKLLLKEFGDYIYPFTDSWPTLDKIWEQNKTLIVSYGDKEIVAEHKWLWPPLKQMWANEQNATDLFTFLDACMDSPKLKEPSSRMWAAMAQLTPSPLDILFNPSGSLRKMANSINHNLTEWCRDLWWNKANIVTSDFFLETNLINIAIASNIQKGNAIKRYYIADEYV